MPDRTPQAPDTNSEGGLPGPEPVLLKNPDFLILWAAGACYGTLRWLEILGIALFTYDQTRSPLAVAGMMFLRMLPMVLFGTLVGAVADRIDRKKLMLLGLTLLSALAGTLALLATLSC